MSRLRVGLAAIALLVGCKSKSEGSDRDGARIGAFPLEAKVDVDEITVDRATSNERLASVFEGAVLRETIRGLFAP